MKKFILSLTLIVFGFLLAGCYLDDVTDMEYGTPSEEELARHQIWLDYHSHETIYLDKNLYDMENIDWLEVFSQDPSFRKLYTEMGEYNFLIYVFVNTHQYLQNGYYNVQLEYHDQSTGYSSGYEIPIIDYSKDYETLYYEEFELTIDGKELHFETFMNDTIKLTYDNNTIYESHNQETEYTYDFGQIKITPIPLGYEIMLNNDVFFVYDMEIFAKND